MKKVFTLFLALILLLPVFAGQKGKVYLVLGSDTSIWEGLSTTIYDNRYFKSALYTDPSEHGFAVMDSSFRSNLTDSYGTPMKMTWWMMAGNLFDMSRNCNIPIRTNITLYLMKKYHQTSLDRWDDQLSLHYHTYNWSDPQGDGIYRWEQAAYFLLNIDDYERTLSTFLIEDGVFPVSFRSGWMYMDEGWQDYQERFIPFDMSDCWTDISEGSEPFHPNAENYREKGNMKQWRVRSEYFTVQYARERGLNSVFRAASEGKNQMLCLWSHLPEAEFLNGMDSVNAMAHRLSEQDTVEFMYCGDVEAMRLWINPNDTIAPILTVNEIADGNGIRYEISTDGPVFQTAEPYVAMKTVYETYERLDCRITGENTWETVNVLDPDLVTNISVAVCDSVGNQNIVHIDKVPDDIFIDDTADNYSETVGTWADYEGTCELWDLNARVLNGSGKITLTPEITEDREYGLFLHAPGSTSDSARVIIENSSLRDTFLINDTMEGRDKWQFLGFYDLESGSGNTISIENLSPDMQMGYDVLRVTPLIADKHFIYNKDMIAFGDISVQDTAEQILVLSNRGKSDLSISEFSIFGSKITLDTNAPFVLAPMETKEISLKYYSDQFCEYNDILTIRTDDPTHELVHIPVFATSNTFFDVYDNEDVTGYTETGSWAFSTAKAWGTSSRFAYIGSQHAYADYDLTLSYSGSYRIDFIIPSSTNSHDHANYIIMVDGTPIDTVVIDQNSSNTEWRAIGEYDLPKNVPITLRVQDNGGKQSSSSIVLRTDAVKFTLLEEKFVSSMSTAGIPDKFKLYQNYPNPFNPSTKIYFALPDKGEVKIDFFNLQGKKVDATIIQDMDAGFHYITWDPGHLSSGIYLYRVSTAGGQAVGRCTYLK